MSRVLNRERKGGDQGGEGEDEAAAMVEGWDSPSLEPLIEALRKTPLAFVALFSKRRGAKSFTLKSLLFELVKRRIVRLDSLLVVSATSDLNRAYDWVPDGQCISDVSEEKLQIIVDFQNDRVRNAQVRARRTGKPVHVPNLCLVLDDIAGAGSINFQTSNAMRFLACNGRHAKIGPIFCLSQQVRGLMGGPGIRSNLDLILSGVLAQSQQRSAWETTVGLSFKDYSHLLATMEPYSFLLFSNLSEARDKRWALIKAPPEAPRFRLGKAASKKSLLQKDKEQARRRLLQRQQQQQLQQQQQQQQ
jgi:hypothetical protein